MTNHLITCLKCGAIIYHGHLLVQAQRVQDKIRRFDSRLSSIILSDNDLPTHDFKARNRSDSRWNWGEVN